MKKLITLFLLTCTLALNAMEQTDEIALTNDTFIPLQSPTLQSIKKILVEKQNVQDVLELLHVDEPMLQFIIELAIEEDKRMKSETEPNELFAIVSQKLRSKKPLEIAKLIKTLHFLDGKALFDTVVSYFVQQVITGGEGSPLWFSEEIAQTLKREYKRQQEKQLSELFENENLWVPRSIINHNCISDTMKEILYRLPVGNKDYETVFSPVFGALPSPDKNYLATISKDYVGQIWNINNLEKPIATINSIYTLEFSSDNYYVATLSRDHTARIWDTNNFNTPIATIDNIINIKFSSDSCYVETLSRSLFDYTLQIWNINNLKNPIASFDNIHWTYLPNDRYIATVSKGSSTQVWWDMNNPKNPIASFDNIDEICFSPNNRRYMATILKNNTAQIWDMNNLKNPVASFDNINERCSIEFSPDNHSVIIWSPNHNIKVYDLSNPKKPISTISHSSWQIGFSSDSNSIITYRPWLWNEDKEDKVWICNYRKWYNEITQEISALNPEQLGLLYQLDQLIQQGVKNAPPETFEIVKTLPPLIQNNIDQHIKLPTNAMVIDLKENKQQPVVESSYCTIQ